MRRWWRFITAVLMTIACVTGCGAAVDSGAVKTEGGPRSIRNPGRSSRTAAASRRPSPRCRPSGTPSTQMPAPTRWPCGAGTTRCSPTSRPTACTPPNPDYLTGVRTETVGRNTVVTYTVNPKAFFNDGTPIDYRAFVETWRTSRGGVDDRYIVSSTDGYSQIASVTRGGVDDREVIVRFDGVYAWPDGLFNVVLHPKATSPEVYNEGYVRQPHPEWGCRTVHGLLV